MDWYIESPNETEHTYCFPGWRKFWETVYHPADRPLKFIVCCVGMVGNLLTLATFLQKSTRSPTTTILTALAFADFLFLSHYLVRISIQEYVDRVGEWRNNYRFLVEEILQFFVHELFHTLSIYLTLVIAVWRLIGVTKPLKGRIWLSSANARWAILGSTLLVILNTCLAYLGVDVEPKTFENRNTTRENDEEDEVGNKPPTDYYFWEQKDLGIWLHGIIVKIIPCVLLSAVTIALFVTLMKAGQNQRALNGHTQQKAKAKDKEGGAGKSKGGFDRTTRMVLTILVIFLITESPLGIFVVVGQVKRHSSLFFKECVYPVSGFTELNELTKSASGFFVYIGLSHQFRTVFTNNVWGWTVEKVKQLSRQWWKIFPPSPKTLGRGSLSYDPTKV